MDGAKRFLVSIVLVVSLLAFLFGFLVWLKVQRYRIAKELTEPELPEVLLTVTPPLGPSGPAEILFSDAGDPKP